MVGTPHWPWRPIDENDVRCVIEAIRRRGPRLVASRDIGFPDAVHRMGLPRRHERRSRARKDIAVTAVSSNERIPSKIYVSPSGSIGTQRIDRAF